MAIVVFPVTDPELRTSTVLDRSGDGPVQAPVEVRQHRKQVEGVGLSDRPLLGSPRSVRRRIPERPEDPMQQVGKAAVLALLTFAPVPVDPQHWRGASLGPEAVVHQLAAVERRSAELA
jgi:hypothetical protein